MANLEAAVEAIIQLLRQFSVSAGLILLQFERFLRSQLDQLGVPEIAQTMILVGMAAALILWALHLFGGLFRIGVVLVLLLIAVHVVVPGFVH